MPHFPPPPQTPPKVGLFRRVPPAIFPPMLGLLGLAAAWRRAAQVIGAPPPLADVLAGAISLLFIFGIAAYLVKLMLRPSVLPEDLSTLPGRLGISALCVGLMVFAGVLAPLAPGLATASLTVGLVLLAALAIYVLAQIMTDRAAFGPLTPALHIIFVGFVVAPVAAVPMGILTALMSVLIWYCLAAALTVTFLTLGPLLRKSSAPPLRPLHAIHLAPPTFLGIDGFLTGQPLLGWSAMTWATLIFLSLLVNARWLTEAGFSPFWSAFTFPLTAYASGVLLAAQVSDEPALRITGAFLLVAATLIVPAIAYRVMKLWATGMLAAKSNAAIA